MKVRMHTSGDDPDAVGHDEGGAYKWKEVPELPAKLKRHMVRCAGCHDDFYNGKANCGGNHCWSLDRDENFMGKGRPKCFH